MMTHIPKNPFKPVPKYKTTKPHTFSPSLHTQARQPTIPIPPLHLGIAAKCNQKAREGASPEDADAFVWSLLFRSFCSILWGSGGKFALDKGETAAIIYLAFRFTNEAHTQLRPFLQFQSKPINAEFLEEMNGENLTKYFSMTSYNDDMAATEARIVKKAKEKFKDLPSSPTVCVGDSNPRAFETMRNLAVFNFVLSALHDEGIDVVYGWATLVFAYNMTVRILRSIGYTTT